MATRATKHIERYYDSHLRDDEEVSQSKFHDIVVQYLIMVLRWLYRAEKVGIIHNVNLYITDNKKEKPISPDITVIDGIAYFETPADEARSYYIGNDTIAPKVVFEISSEETWPNDIKLPAELEPDEELVIEGKRQKINPKLPRYEALGIREYFAFDPHQPTVWTKEWKKENRLVGWRLDNEGKYARIGKNEDGWLWSEQLNSFLVVDGQYLRLYDEKREMRLTGEEYGLLMSQQNQLERQRAETAEREKQVLLDKLRSLGIDPDAL